MKYPVSTSHRPARLAIGRLAAGLVAAALLLAGCGGRAPAEPQPPDIAYGQDMCDACGMLIDAPKFAAATALADGTARKFDDMGEMFAYHREHPDEQVRAWFVHDYDTEAWVRAEGAHFVHSENIQTPMGSGVVAFESESAAKAFADPLAAEVLSFDVARTEAAAMRHGQP